MDLGRKQPGNFMTISVAVTDGSDPAWPDEAPVATITNEDDDVVWTGRLAMTPTPYEFSRSFFLGNSYPLGTYQVEYEWTVGGTPDDASDTFTVAPGGDVGGGIIAMHAYDRPEAKYVVAQLTSGNIVQGRNPRL